jgi:NNP family nitrate/nitrite transporter-like MFS transporter
VALSAVGIAFSSRSLIFSLLWFIVGMGCLGVGNGSVFQLIPQRFRREIGILTGLVGMAGGIGGFYLAISLGYSKQWTGDYRSGFLLFGGLGLLALLGIWLVKRRWRSTWGSPLVTTARI